MCLLHLFFFFQAEDGIRDLTVTGVQTCALPICVRGTNMYGVLNTQGQTRALKVYSEWSERIAKGEVPAAPPRPSGDRKSTRLNSSHSQISYAVFCLKKKRRKQWRGVVGVGAASA